MIMGIDHGYYAIKTRHFSFPAGVTVYILLHRCRAARIRQQCFFVL